MIVQGQKLTSGNPAVLPVSADGLSLPVSGSVTAAAPVSVSVDIGQTLAAGAAAAAFGTSKVAQLGVYVCSLLANTKAVYVGLGAGVLATTGIELQPGDREFFPVANSNLLFVIAADATVQNVHALAV